MRGPEIRRAVHATLQRTSYTEDGQVEYSRE